MPRIKQALGLGLRHVHVEYILQHWPEVGWFEVISENFMFSAGRPRQVLRQIAERYPIVMHGVSLSLGSTDALDKDYLRALKNLADEVKPEWISDHLCWTGVLGYNTHDLLPLPLTDESLDHVAKRIDAVQDFLARPLVLENPSTYLRYTHSTWSEAAFLAELVKRTGCKLLFDVNNCHVSCFNSGQDPLDYLAALPLAAIVQLHLAGHQHCGTHIIDTHDRPVAEAVWQLFRHTWHATGGVATLLEWDGNIPSFEVCMAELGKARQYMSDETGTACQQPPLPAIATALLNEAALVPEAMPEAISTPVDFLLGTMQREARHFA